MKTVRADLHMHGPIGFQPFWLKRQGYAGKNILQLIADEAFRKGITITAITSQSQEIPRGSVHDRFGCLRDYEAPLLPAGYVTERIGDNVLVVEKGAKKLFVVNGQTVMPREDAQDFDMLVVGSNRVPNFRSFEDTLAYCSDHGLIKIAEHPYVETHRGMGEKRLERHIDDFDAIEGHNAQTIFPDWMARVPLVGSTFSRAGRELNDRAKQTAREHSKPYIATSDAHRIQDLGISYIEWVGELDASSEDNLIGGLQKQIRSNRFKTHERYESIAGWMRWVYTFQTGIRVKRDDNEPFIASDQFR